MMPVDDEADAGNGSNNDIEDGTGRVKQKGRHHQIGVVGGGVITRPEQDGG